MRGVLVGAALAALMLSGCGPAAAPSSDAEATIDPSSASGPTLVPGAVTAPPAGDGLDLTALNIDFEPKELVAPAGPVAISFHNQDNGIPHNVQVNDASGATVYQGEILTGPSDTQESIGDLSPGAYTFVCTIHPNMQGTLTILP